mgnify:CR=1 FL=1
MRRGKQCEIEFDAKLKGGNHVRTASEKNSKNYGTTKALRARTGRTRRKKRDRQSRAGLLAIAIGWVFAFLMLLVPETMDYTSEEHLRVVLCMFSIAAIGFGCGWNSRDDL